MIRTLLSMVVRPGCEQEFERAWTAAAEAISECPGNLDQAFMRDVGEHRRYLITSDWASADALQAFQSSDQRKALSEALEPLRESATKSVLDVIATVGGKTERSG